MKDRNFKIIFEQYRPFFNNINEGFNKKTQSVSVDDLKNEHNKEMFFGVDEQEFGKTVSEYLNSLKYFADDSFSFQIFQNFHVEKRHADFVLHNRTYKPFFYLYPEELKNWKYYNRIIKPLENNPKIHNIKIGWIDVNIWRRMEETGETCQGYKCVDFFGKYGCSIGNMKVFYDVDKKVYERINGEKHISVKTEEESWDLEKEGHYYQIAWNEIPNKYRLKIGDIVKDNILEP